MTESTATVAVGLPGTRIEIDCCGSKAAYLLDFLFRDLPISTAPVSKRRFTVRDDPSHPGRLHLYEGQTQLYSGDCGYDFAYTLFNVVLEEGVCNNQEHLALHAAALVHNGCGFVFPGKSGAGKSSLAAWLTLARGGYLTDELVFLGHDGTIHPVTRPLSLKPSAMAVLIGHVPLSSGEYIAGRRGTMLAHRHLWSNWQAVTPRLNALVFPRFTPGISPSLTPLPPGQACLYLMESYVNARNYSDHGFSRLAQIVRGVPAYFLRFGGFDGVLQCLRPLYASQQ